MGTRIPPSRVVASSLAIAAAALSISACGSSDSKSTSTAASGGSSTTGSSSGQISLPKKTIVYGEVAAVDEITNRNVTQMKTVAKAFGWDLKYLNAQGDVAKLIQFMTNGVNQGADALVVGSTDAAAIKPALTAAQRKKIPAIVIGGGVSPSPLYAAQYTEDETAMSKTLAEQMVKDLGGKGSVATMDISQLSSGAARHKALADTLSPTGIKIVASKAGDLADPVQGSKKIASALLASQPKLSALWAVYDYMLPPAAEVLKSSGRKNVKLYTFFGGPENVRIMRENPDVGGLSEDNFDHTALITMDQLARFFKDGTPLDPEAASKCPLKYQVITPNNEPPEGQLLWPVDKNRAPFVANWKAGKFGQGADCGT
jgi:ABC-type sugar transport system substrate-binding protein